MIVTAYYQTPPIDVFLEVQAAAASVLCTLGNTYEYVTEKLEEVARTTNHSDNWMGLIAMFDLPHQHMLLDRLTPATFDLAVAAAESVGYDFYAKWPVS